MKAPAVQTQGATGDKHQEWKIGKEGLDMKAQASEARVRISQALGQSVGARLFRVAALGALLVGATALYTSMSQEAAGSPPADIPAHGSQTAAPAQALAPKWRINPELDRAVEQEELLKDYRAMGIRWDYDAFGNVVASPLSDRELENLDYARTMMLFAEAKATPSIDQRFPPGTLSTD